MKNSRGLLIKGDENDVLKASVLLRDAGITVGSPTLSSKELSDEYSARVNLNNREKIRSLIGDLRISIVRESSLDRILGE